MPRREPVEVPVVGREDATSFWGGAGGATSGAVGGVAAPRGPRGSSTASSLVVDWVPYWRLRGPLAAGERGAAEAEVVEESWVATVGERVSGLLLSSCPDVEAFCAVGGPDCDGTSAYTLALSQDLVAWSA